MKRTAFTYGLLILFAMVLLAGVRRNTAEAQPVPVAVKNSWEYAVMGRLDRDWYWKTDGIHAGGDLAAIYKAVGGTGTPDRVMTQMVLSRIGALGWELCAIDGEPNDKTYWFKRQKQ